MKKLLLILVLLSVYRANAQNTDRTKLLADIETLSADKYEGRKTGTQGNRMAARYIINRFKESGLKPFNEDFEHLFPFKNTKNEEIKGTNLIAYIKGRSEEMILISAHYDHVGINNSTIFNGADDNASGVAAILAIAEYFKKHKPKNTLLFIACDAEEMGLQGAYAFLKDPVTAKDKIRLNINLDMVSHNEKSELYAAGSYKTPVLKKILKDSDKDTGINIRFGHDVPGTGHEDWTMQSDHGPFAKESIAFVYFGVEDHQDYHRPSDIYANINQDFFYSASNAILRSIIILDKSLDLINPN
ncbi:MAG: M28 family peptidase [Pedobacter sp.]|jgi:Zn-dependent M28 family amino/carboxypeptidase